MNCPLTSLRHHLRQATSQAHTDAERAVEALAPFSSETAYHRFLSALLMLHETGLAAASSLNMAELLAMEQEAVALLRTDLEKRPKKQPLEFQAASHSGTAFTPFEGAGEITGTLRLSCPPPCDAGAWGKLYVCRGSALGGAVLSSRAAQLKIRNSRIGNGYLTSCARTGGTNWRRFCTLLETAQPDPGTAEAGALDMFGTFGMVLRTKG